MGTGFPPTDKTRIRRKPDRGSYDEDLIFAILDAGVIAHVGYAIDGEAHVTPTAYWREGRRLYWHGSSASRMLRAQAQGMPVCVTVSHLDGFLVSRSGFATSVLYRSVMAFGRTAPVTEIADKRRAMDAFIDRLFPGRTQEIRPPHPQELQGMSLVAMTIEAASAKARGGGVVDRPEDYAARCWAGVVPVRTVVGRIAPDDRLLVDPAPPACLGEYVDGARLDDVLAATGRRRGTGGNDARPVAAATEEGT